MWTRAANTSMLRRAAARSTAARRPVANFRRRFSDRASKASRFFDEYKPTTSAPEQATVAVKDSTGKTRVFVERVRKMRPEAEAAARAANPPPEDGFFIKHVGKLGLGFVAGVIFYVYRGWTGTDTENEAIKSRAGDFTVSFNEIKELRKTNSEFYGNNLVELAEFVVGRKQAETMAQRNFEGLIRKYFEESGAAGASSQPGSEQFPIRLWHTLDRLIQTLPADSSSSLPRHQRQLRVPDLLFVASLAANGTPDQLLHALYRTSCLLSEGSSSKELPVRALPSVMRSLKLTNQLPAGTLTRCTGLWPWYEYGEATAHDIVRSGLEAMMEDKSSEFPRVHIPAEFGSEPPQKLHQAIVELVSPTPTEEREAEALLRREAEGQLGDAGQTISFEDFHALMTSHSVCIWGTCRDKNKKAAAGAGKSAALTVSTDAITVADAAQRMRLTDSERIAGGEMELQSVFISSDTFQGKKDGFYFGSGPHGVGYHKDYVGVARKAIETDPATG